MRYSTCLCRLWSFLSVSLLAVAVAAASASEVQKTVYSWAVVPQFTSFEVHRDWTPVLQHLSEKTGVVLELDLYNDIGSFEKAFLKAKPDFVYMNPYHLVIAREAHPYIPLVRDDSEKLKGILVVRKDSPIRTIDELRGRRIAFPSPNAFSSSLYMRSLLTEKEGLNYIPVYAGTHSNAYRHTLLGITEANGAVVRTLEKQPASVQAALRILYETPAVPSRPVAVHARVPASIYGKIRDELIAMGETEARRSHAETCASR